MLYQPVLEFAISIADLKLAYSLLNTNLNHAVQCFPQYQVAIDIGNLLLAYQCLKNAISTNPERAMICHTVLSFLKYQVAIGIGDLSLAYQCLKIAISINPSHAEAYNNLGVLEYRKGNDEQSRSYFR